MKAQKQIYSGDKVKITDDWWTHKRKTGTVKHIDSTHAEIEISGSMTEWLRVDEITKIGK